MTMKWSAAYKTNVTNWSVAVKSVFKYGGAEILETPTMGGSFYGEASFD